MMRRMGLGIGLLLATLGAETATFGDEGTGARSTDAVVKEWVDEFRELNKKKTTAAGQERQLKLIKDMEFGPCGTAVRFLSGLVKSKKTPGDQRLYAMRSLLRMADKKSFTKLLAALSKARDPALWDMFGRELLVRPSGAVREWAAGPAIKSRDPQMLGAFLDARARRPDKALTKSLGKLCARHAKAKGNPEIAFRALHAHSRLYPAQYTDELELATTHPEWRVRLAAADILPSLKPLPVEASVAIRTLIQDESPHVQRAVISAIALHRCTAFGDLLAAKVGDSVARTRHVAVRALETIYGQKHGHDQAAWAKVVAGETPDAPSTVEAPRYHGIEIHSDEVVFVVDASSSMGWPWQKASHRIDVARSELEKTLAKLAPKTRFNVMVFNEARNIWSKGAKPATPQNTSAAAAWAAGAMAEPAGDTHLYEAIEAALQEHPDCDTVFLLTDGNPTAGRYWSIDGIMSGVRSWTRFRRTAINTIGLSLLSMDPGRPNLAEKPDLMASLLKQIAQSTAGEFREIKNVPK